MPRDSDMTHAELSPRARQRSRASREIRTLRDQFMRRMRKVYRFLLGMYQSLIKLITIHSTKFALLVLFFVTAFQPNIVNAVLFVMFLLLAMSNNS